MKVITKRLEAPFYFEAQNETGNKVFMDSSKDGKAKGMSPMQLLLAGIGGCSSIDIVSILEKQRQPLEDIQVSAEAQRAQGQPAVFTKIHLHYVLKGDLEEDKVKRAIDLSLDTYCSVSKMLDKTAKITYTFIIEK